MRENFRILKPFLRGLPIIIICMIIGVVGAKKYLSYVTPIYESTSKIKLADIGEGIPNSNLFKNLDVFASANKISAEIEVLKSSNLIFKTLNTLDFNLEIYRAGSIQTVELYHNSPIAIRFLNSTGKVLDKRFKLIMKTDKVYDILNTDGKVIVSGEVRKPLSFLDNEIIVDLNFDVISQKKAVQIVGNYEFEFFSQEKLLEKIYKNLDIVSVDKDVAVLRINLKSNVPEKAAAFVNKLGETYIEDYIESKYKAANTTVIFLEKQIKEASSKLAQSENSIEDYRNDNHIVNLKQETETDLRKISQLKIQQTNLKMNLEAIEELNRYINFGKSDFLSLAPNFEAFTDLLSTEIIKNIKKLQSEKRDLLLTYTKNDEKVVVIDEKITDLINYLVESIKNTRINLEVKYKQITEDIDLAESVFTTVPAKEKNLTIMNRDFDLLQSSYNFLNEKKIEAEIAQAAKISFHRVLTPAVISEKPISPNRPIIIILCALIGMIGSVFLIYLVHFIKAKVNDAQAIEQNSNIPLAISTPFMRSNSESVFRKNVIQLEIKKILTTNNVLTISAFDAKQGRGYNVINIIKTLSKQNRRVILIDAKGDLAFLRTNVAESADLWASTIENVFYVDFYSNKFQNYSQEEVKLFIQSFKDKCDLVIVNNEFLVEQAKSVLLLSLSDSNLFVVDSRTTPLAGIKKLQVLKEEFNIINLNFLLNKSGYNPSVVREFVVWLKKIIKRNEKF